MNFKLKKYMEDIKNGKNITIGFIGGSITQGSLATKNENSYSSLVFKWFKENFKNDKIGYVNAGIGGTTSYFGVSRVVDDLLIYQPSIVFIDFSVNDDADVFFQETFEGLIRKILNWNLETAIVILNNVYYDTGKNTQCYHNEIADYYKIPYVSVYDTIYQDIQKGIYTVEELTPDNLHPNDKGHSLIANEITKLLDNIYNNSNDIVESTLKEKPFTKNRFENTKRLNICNSQPILNGFYPDFREKKGYLDVFKNGWVGEKTGDKIMFNIEASTVAIQYRKTINKPSPIANVIINNNIKEKIILDGNFEEDWGDCLYLQKIIDTDVKEKYKIEIEIISATEEDKEPFYLLSLIIS